MEEKWRFKGQNWSIQAQLGRARARKKKKQLFKRNVILLMVTLLRCFWELTESFTSP